MITASIFPCPNCAHLLTFSSAETTLIICSSCANPVKRTGGSLQVRPDLHIVTNASVIQPGSTGEWDGKSFTVLGRFRAWFDESVFSYWTIQLPGDELAWLGEGYGIYSILKPAAPGENIAANVLKGMDIGQLKTFESPGKVMLGKKQRAHKWELEGETSIPGTAAEFLLYEFSSMTSTVTCFFEFDQALVQAEVTYVSFKSLQLRNLREYVNPGNNFTCSNCSKPILVKTFPYAQSCACESCGSFYTWNKGAGFTKKKDNKSAAPVSIFLGSQGTIHDIQYEVVGYAQKEELNSHSSRWREYVLFNPTDGFAFLSEFDGHWMYVKENYNSPVIFQQTEREFTFDKEPFSLYNAYNSKVIYATGEFPYNVFDNEKTRVREYISPPLVWIQERDEKEGITWFLGEHVPARDIKKGFVVNSMPYTSGIGAVQPAGYVSRVKIIVVAFFAVLFLMLTHSLINMGKREQVLLNKQYLFSDSIKHLSLVTEKFELDKWSSNLRFSIRAPVYNSWFELGATLVNTQTGKEYSVEQGVEYYSGYSEGEHWSEGSDQEDAYLSKIPAGTYFLQLEATRESISEATANFSLELTYDVPSDRNLGWAVGLLLLWPLGKYWLVKWNEERRWSNSPYSEHDA
ncbi:MAG: DUF4178 domain-containing protein [Bacteroidota bacterium]